AGNAGCEQLAHVTGAASKIPHHPTLIEKVEEREQVSTLANHVGTHRVPRAVRGGEEILRAAASRRHTLLENTGSRARLCETSEGGRGHRDVAGPASLNEKTPTSGLSAPHYPFDRW